MKNKILLSIALLLITCAIHAQASAPIPRALWASVNGHSKASLGDYQTHNNKILVSWRMLPGEDGTTGFDLYRKPQNGIETRVATNITNSTCFQDSKANRNVDNTYRLTYHGSNETLDTHTIKAEQAKLGLPYISIPLKNTKDVCSTDTIFYTANDCSVGDLDGDGVYEIVVKRLLTVKNSKGEQLSDGTGSGTSQKDVRHTVIWDAYKLDGTFMWRIKSGPNVPLGNSSSFAIADFDGDGCCEMGIRTAEGTVFGDGVEIGDTNGDGKTDYRTWTGTWMDHYNSAGSEFISIIDGKTGKELARDNFITRGRSEDWGDNYFKRSNSFRIGAAACDGQLPSLIVGRGVYARSVIEAWDYRNNQLTKRWHFDSNNYPGEAYAGQGFHSFATADVDGDGFDEVVYGSMTVDHDGKPYSTTGLGHGDALHVGKYIKDSENLQIFACFETGKTMVALRDAKTDEILWKRMSDKDGDMGRCMIADIDPDSPGFEMWYAGGHAFSANGRDLGYKPSSCNMGIWFDGTLTRQLINKNTIHSEKYGRTFTMYRYSVSFNNGTKSNPGWYGDFLGDWREEVIVPDNSKLVDIKIFSTWYPTTHKFPWLMTDPVYKMSAINQNIGYNQPTDLGYYLGSDLTSDEEAWIAAGIKDVVIPNNNRYKDSDYYYNLNGQRMVFPPSRGIYIHKGKKIITTGK